MRRYRFQLGILANSPDLSKIPPGSMLNQTMYVYCTPLVGGYFVFRPNLNTHPKRCNCPAYPWCCFPSSRYRLLGWYRVPSNLHGMSTTIWPVDRHFWPEGKSPKSDYSAVLSIMQHLTELKTIVHPLGLAVSFSSGKCHFRCLEGHDYADHSA